MKTHRKELFLKTHRKELFLKTHRKELFTNTGLYRVRVAIRVRTILIFEFELSDQFLYYVSFMVMKNGDLS